MTTDGENMTEPEQIPQEPSPQRLHQRLFTVHGLAEVSPGLTQGQIRGYCNRRKENGLEDFHAIYKPGGRTLLIDADAFDQWLTSKRDER